MASYDDESIADVTGHVDIFSIFEKEEILPTSLKSLLMKLDPLSVRELALYGMILIEF